MEPGTVYVYGRPGIGSSSTGSHGAEGKLDTGHVFLTVQDNETGRRVDVDIWNGPYGQMTVNDNVDNARREAHDVVAFDVNRQALDRMLAAADTFHMQSIGYSVMHMNCTDAVEYVLRAGLQSVPDFTLPSSVFSAVLESGEQGNLPNFRSHLSEPISDTSHDGALSPTAMNLDTNYTAGIQGSGPEDDLQSFTSWIQGGDLSIANLDLGFSGEGGSVPLALMEAGLGNAVLTGNASDFASIHESIDYMVIDADPRAGVWNAGTFETGADLAGIADFSLEAYGISDGGNLVDLSSLGMVGNESIADIGGYEMGGMVDLGGDMTDAGGGVASWGGDDGGFMGASYGGDDGGSSFPTGGGDF